MEQSDRNGPIYMQYTWDGFEQKSRLLRHIENSHPPQAPLVANVEKVLGGIDYPKTKDEIVQYSSQKSFMTKIKIKIFKAVYTLL